MECMGAGFCAAIPFRGMPASARASASRIACCGIDQYLDCHVAEHFHLNGDFKSAAVALHYRPFTLEGNFGAGHAINEMLLQAGRPAALLSGRAARGATLRSPNCAARCVRHLRWRKDGEFARAKLSV